MGCLGVVGGVPLSMIPEKRQESFLEEVRLVSFRIFLSDCTSAEAIDTGCISLSLKERICTLHALCFGLNKYILTCVEVGFLLDSGSTQKTDLVRGRYILCFM